MFWALPGPWVNNGLLVLWGISYAIRKLHSAARSAGGCERSTARRERLGYWLGSAASAIPGTAVERFFEGLGLVELD